MPKKCSNRLNDPGPKTMEWQNRMEIKKINKVKPVCEGNLRELMKMALSTLLANDPYKQDQITQIKKQLG